MIERAEIIEGLRSRGLLVALGNELARDFFDARGWPHEDIITYRDKDGGRVLSRITERSLSEVHCERVAIWVNDGWVAT